MSLLWLVKLQITRYEILLSDCHKNRIYKFLLRILSLYFNKRFSQFEYLGHFTLPGEDNTGKGISKENCLPTGKGQAYVKPTYTG